MIKTLVEKYDINISNLINKEQKRLDLNYLEASVLIALISINKSTKKFSLNSIKRKINIPENDLGNILSRLAEKGFYTIEVSTQNSLKQEVFNIEPTYKKLEDLINKDIAELLLKEQKSQISETISILENEYEKELSASELETIRTWYGERQISHEIIINAITSLKKRKIKPTIYQIQKFLNISLSRSKEVQDIDEKTREALNKIFKVGL